MKICEVDMFQVELLLSKGSDNNSACSPFWTNCRRPSDSDISPRHQNTGKLLVTHQTSVDQFPSPR